jgi:hypothetical protein
MRRSSGALGYQPLAAKSRLHQSKADEKQSWIKSSDKKEWANFSFKSASGQSDLTPAGCRVACNWSTQRYYYRTNGSKHMAGEQVQVYLLLSVKFDALQAHV